MAQKIWFVLENSRSLGPFSQTELERLVSRHELESSALVWSEGQARWRPAGEVKLARKRVLPPLPKRAKPRYLVRIITSFFGIIFSVFILAFLSVKIESPLKELGLRPSVRKVLEDIRQTPYRRGEQRFGWAIDESGTGLYMVTNFSQGTRGEAKISLTATSIPERMLDQKSIVAKSQAKIKDGLAHFQEWNLQKGSHLIPGEYRVEVEAYAPGTGKRVFFHRGKILFYKGGRPDFERKLEQYQAVLARKREQRFSLQDRIQRYKSFVALIERLRILYRKGRKSGFQKGHFEGHYHKEIGPHLWGLISDSDLLHLNWMNIDPAKGRDYEKLTDFGKEIGDLAVNMLDRLEGGERGQGAHENLLTYADTLESLGLKSIGRLNRQLKLDIGN